MAEVDKQIFLSYGREPEVTAFVRKLRDDLVSMGFSIWFDQTDIPAGSDWHGAVGTGLDRCKALIAVITHKYVESRFCLSELYTANGDRKLVFPVFYENPDLSASEQARGVKYVVSGINWTMFRPGMDVYEESLQKLADGMRSKGLGSGHVQSHVTSSNPQQLPRSTVPDVPPPPYSTVDAHHNWPQDYVLCVCGNWHAPFQCPYGSHGTSSPQYLPGYSSGHSPSPLPYPEQYSSMPAAGYPPEVMATSLQMYPSAPYQEETLSDQMEKLDLSRDLQKLETNSFEVGMKLEARDRKNPSMVCVATVTRIQDGCLLIHFDGWTEKYDYWCESTTQDIHPVGWCEQHKYTLQPPKGMSFSFQWSWYLNNSSAVAAPENLFTMEQLAKGPPVTTTSNSCCNKMGENQCRFRPGMRLEALDQKHPTMICVATVQNVQNHQLLIHFDGWSDMYDYWCKCTSTDIHPIGYCQRAGRKLEPPKDTEFPGWSTYLKSIGAQAAPESLFEPSQCIPGKTASQVTHQEFVVGMKLEAVDRQHPSLICVATVADIKGSKLLIHFDGWTDKYDYWCNNDCDEIHPIGWCKRNSVVLQAPKGMKAFYWEEYLKSTKSVAAPQHLFLKH